MIKLTPEKPPYYEIVGQTFKHIYMGILTQTGTNAPAEITPKNTINGVWTRQEAGKYRYTKTGIFLQDKIWAIGLSTDVTASSLEIYRVTDDIIEVACRSLTSFSTFVDDALSNTCIIIITF